MKRLGMLSLGQLTALCTVAGVLAVMAVHGHQLFSPGTLNAESRHHVALNGVTSHAEIARNCAACHAPPWSGETMSSRCLDCHTDVREQLDHKKPMHGLLAQGQTCQSCHTEHKGPHAALTNMDTFDHSCTAFPLTGQHQAVDCKACHTSNFYKGTPQTCAACHAEPKEHMGRFGTACAACHSTSNWQASTSTLVKFDHSRTRYPLTGKHKAVNCKACHAKEVVVPASSADLARTLNFFGAGTPSKLTVLAAKTGAIKEVFKGTPQTCASCHAEPKKHKGRYGVSCATCHATSDWQDITFRHSFPLNHGGNRKATSCAACHPTTENFKTYTCYGCHHTPAKEQQRHARRKIADLNKCTVCHPTGRGTVRRTALLEECPELHVVQGCPEMGQELTQACAFLTTAPRQNLSQFFGRNELFQPERMPAAQAPRHTPLNKHQSAADLLQNQLLGQFKLMPFGIGDRTHLGLLGVGPELPLLRIEPAPQVWDRDRLLLSRGGGKSRPFTSAGTCPLGRSLADRGGSCPHTSPRLVLGVAGDSEW